MSRPHKPRNIYKLPKYSVYGPKGVKMNKLNRLKMKIDELETIRLIDYLGYTQEEAAKQMNVGRTTVQRIYDIARKKISTSLIEGSILIIEGGQIILCDEDSDQCLKPRRLNKGNRYGHRN